MSSPESRRRVSLSRVLLLVAILLLSGVLAFLAWLFLELQPSSPLTATQQQNDEMQWVRSIYGFGDSADEQLYAPSSVAVGIDDRGQLYIADSWANKIVVYDEAGNYIREWAIPAQARGVDVVGDEVFVLSMGRVFVFDKTGVLLIEFGRRGAAPGEIDAYQGVTADEERIYVADSFNRRIQAFDREGELVWARPLYGGDSKALFAVEDTPSVEPTGTVQSEDAEEFAWDLPQDLTFDGAGRLVVVDAFRFQLVVVDPETGDVIESFGEFGREDGRFYYPSSVAYDNETDWFVVADTQNNRVQIVRIPDSGDGLAQAAARVAQSPSRFVIYPLLVPLVLLLLILSVWLARRFAAKARARYNG